MSYGVAGIGEGSATSSKTPGNYFGVKTQQAGTSSGIDLVIDIEVKDDQSIEVRNIINRGENWLQNDLFTIDRTNTDNDHGPNTQMTVIAVTDVAVPQTKKFNRQYIQVQPDRRLGPPTFNLSDRDLYDSTSSAPPVITPSVGLGNADGSADIRKHSLVFAIDSGTTNPTLLPAKAAVNLSGDGNYDNQMNVIGIALNEQVSGATGTVQYTRYTRITIDNVDAVVDGAPTELVTGKYYYLSATTPGNWSASAPTGEGNCGVVCGLAVSSTDMLVEIQTPIIDQGEYIDDNP